MVPKGERPGRVASTGAWFRFHGDKESCMKVKTNRGAHAMLRLIEIRCGSCWKPLGWTHETRWGEDPATVWCSSCLPSQTREECLASVDDWLADED